MHLAKIILGLVVLCSHPKLWGMTVPFAWLGKDFTAGGVVVKVSHPSDENLGMLKAGIGNYSPIKGRLVVKDGDDGAYLTLMGCYADCRNGQEVEIQEFQLKIKDHDYQKRRYIIDTQVLGSRYNIAHLIDPEGDYFRLKEISSTYASSDQSFLTATFDVHSEMDFLGENVTLVNRWFLHLDTKRPFIERNGTEGIGYFETWDEDSRITRFRTSQPIKYYAKNFPDHVKPAVTKALMTWNLIFIKEIGRPLITWEFMDDQHPQAHKIISGDIRYNVIEWDIDNQAPYGGYGPSISHPVTGEILSAWSLIQGPTIERIYRRWFDLYGAQRLAKETSDLGALASIGVQLKSFHDELEEINKSFLAMKKQLKGMGLRNNTAELLHPILQRPALFEPPEEESYESYMHGYWVGLIGHEVGHNLGLRHNFKGNLGANFLGESSSVMEYLDPNFTYKNSFGKYDYMAIAYGYGGKEPLERNLFCTDEHVNSSYDPFLNAECSRDDGSRDPFSYYSQQVDRIIELITAPGQSTAPLWRTEELISPLVTYAGGMFSYYSSAEEYWESWSRWGDARPRFPEGIQDYVSLMLDEKVCNPNLSEAISEKEGADAKERVKDNIRALESFLSQIGTYYAWNVGFSCS